jgi:hypothetical protein
MFKLKQSFITFAGPSLVVGLVALVSPATMWGQGNQQPLNVNVVNTPTVRNVDEPARQPFQRSRAIVFAPGESTGTAEFFVPLGKRFVIEYVSAQIDMGVSFITVTGFSVRTSTDNPPGTPHFFVPMSPPSNTGSNSKWFIVSQQTRLYADPGSTVTIVAELFVAPALVNSISGRASLSGYLIDP